MKEISKYCELRQYLAASCSDKPIALVGIEGFQGSGKTYLGTDLANDFGSIFLDLDKYVREGDESLPYFERIDTKRLKSDIDDALARGDRVFVAGICLRDVLASLGISANLMIYIKRVSAPRYYWDDGDELQAYISGTDHQGLCEAHKSDFAYHANVCPHENADIIFIRIES